MQAESPGYTTTEFWTTLLLHAIAVATTLLTTLHVTVINGSTLTPLVPMIALIASAIGQAFYTYSRGTVKAAVTAANAAAGTVTPPVKSGDPFTIDPASIPTPTEITSSTTA